MTLSKQASNDSSNSSSGNNEINSQDETQKSEEQSEENETQSNDENPQQSKRFNFYTEQVAEEIRRETSKEEEEPKQQTNRFHFYNAAEVGPIEHKRTEPSDVSASTTNVERSPSLSPKISDSQDILKSLQETERRQQQQQRPSSKTPRHANRILSKQEESCNNPYKNAIQEALCMLQQQSSSTTTTNEDVVMKMRIQEPSAEARKKERLYRKERIAKYALRLEEMNSPRKSSLSPPRPEQAPTTTTTLWTRPTLVEQANAEELIRLRSESPPSEEERHATTSFDTQAQLNVSMADSSLHSQQVQKSVENVLLAILERANASSSCDQTDENEPQDALNTAMSNLLQPSLSFETISTVRSRRPNRRESDQQALHFEEQCKSSSVVEELLEDEKKGEGGDSDDYITPVSSSTELRVDDSHESIEVVESSDVFDDEEEEEYNETEEDATSTSATSTSASNSYNEEEEEDYDEDDPKNVSVDESTLTHLLGKLRRRSDADREVDEEREDEDDENLSVDENTLINVLGPLNSMAGGTTGVVLEATSYEEEEPPPPPPPLHEDEGSTPLSPASIYETLSSAVKDAESFMSYISGGYPPVKDKYSTGDDDETAILARGAPPRPEDDGDAEADAHELMRSLCAHLLPYGVDKSSDSSVLDRIPVWDESNPDEAGYRIIRLTKRQLHSVELEFDKMVKSVKHSSERDLKGSLSKTDAGDDWNGVQDDDFARDLEAAEELLDREEKRREEDDRAKARTDPEESGVDDESASSSESELGSSESDTMERTRSPLSDDDTLLTTHPDFPGVKTTGKGEIGDLEYFHLPIIYKSNVTGFEPTKDLYLEPGNVVAGQYLVESELGSAAFSTAYRCVDLSSEMRTTEKGEEVQEEVCLKVIKNTKDFFDQSLDEIKILELLRQTGKCHEKHILEMKTFFYHREHLIIVTELLRQNLFEFGKFIMDSDEERYFTRTRLCYITRQVLIALDFVHQMGLVHSDVKPENILLSSYSRAKVKLIDFGSSCYLTDRQSSYIQSRSYRAPEVVLGLPYDGKIDMWSLGCVVAEMYTGEVTFQNDSIVSMLSRIEAICGSFPRQMIASGRQSGRFFTKSGLLYEQVDSENTEGGRDKGLLDVFQPKRTSLAARLGLPDIETEDEAHFVDFCSKLLAVDPDSRPTAAEALKHPWIVACEAITEEDIKYPSK